MLIFLRQRRKKMFKEASALFIYTVTPLHAGSGASVGVVDLPIQREKLTNYPIIQSSGVKGALRDLAEKLGVSDVEIVFGPKKEAEKHGGALFFTDARVLLFPVRSLKGVFGWITCPAVLEKFKRDMNLLKINQKNITALEELEAIKIPEIKKENEVCIPNGSNLEVYGKVVLEEFSFDVENGENRANADKLAEWFAKYTLPKYEEKKENYWTKKLKTDLIIVHDNVFRDFVQFSTEVITRIKIGETGTVAEGPWDVENLPSETLLYSIALAMDSRAIDDQGKPIKKAQDVLNSISNIISKVSIVQFGGDETLGRGIAQVSLLK
jgi:CRISPR-associated protein Cmr4